MGKEICHPVLEGFLFHLPEDRIAQYPAEKRENSRLMVISRKTGTIRHAHFHQLPEYLETGDFLITNNTYVEKKRVYLRRKSGARLESIFLDKTGDSWEVLMKNARRIANGEILYAEKAMEYTFSVSKTPEGIFLTPLFPAENSGTFLERIGEMPIPPYLARGEESIDRERYQSIFAVKEMDGSAAAAPTASFHFSHELVDALAKKGVGMGMVRLNIGYGTFAPLRSINFEKKELHEEAYVIPEITANRLRGEKKGRIIAVGTTSLRTLETVWRKTGGEYHHSLQGKTRLFLYPPDKIQSVDGLITNFHLPGSSLILLVATFLEKELLLRAYAEAIEQEYRFFSYGDAMLIL